MHDFQSYLSPCLTMIAVIEGNPKPGSWAGILISKYPEWIDRIEGEIGSIRKLRGVCPKCQEFRTLTKNKRLKKWRCPKCKRYYAEEEITNETIRFVFSNRNNHALGERAVLFVVTLLAIELACVGIVYLACERW